MTTTGAPFKVLVVDDSNTIRRSAEIFLKQGGHEVVLADDGFDALAKINDYHPQLIFCDILMPKLDGYQTVAIIKRNARFANTPVVMLSSKDGVFDKARGRMVGCQDYLTKPFDLQELMARLRAIIRRASGGASPTLAHGGVVLDPAAKRVTHKGEPVSLSAREYALLYDMLRHKNEIRSRAQLEDSLYAWGEETGSNTVEVYVHHLRKKFGSAFIQTIRGLGYQLGEEGKEP